MRVSLYAAAMARLDGKVFIITGGNGGIGLGMAEGIADAGGRIVVWGRREDKNLAAVERLQARGADATAFVCDVADPDQVTEVMDRSIAAMGSGVLEVLVDTEASKENVARAAQNKGWRVDSITEDGGEFRLKLIGG